MIDFARPNEDPNIRYVRKPASSMGMFATAAFSALLSRPKYSLPPPERSASSKGIAEYPTYRPGVIITAGLSSAVTWEVMRL
jgi:hypothetical protein